MNSEAAAEAAYVGLDEMVGKALSLGFDGFNAASSANIAEQTTTGNVMGMLAVNGQVDQGASDNKGMRLTLTLTDYQDVAMIGEDELAIVYATGETLPELTIQLRNIPSGTLSGTLMGNFRMTGDLVDDVALNLSFSGEIEDDGNGGTQRVAGSTQVTGTATSTAGVFDVNVTI